MSSKAGAELALTLGELEHDEAVLILRLLCQLLQAALETLLQPNQDRGSELQEWSRKTTEANGEWWQMRWQPGMHDRRQDPAACLGWLTRTALLQGTTHQLRRLHHELDGHDAAALGVLVVAAILQVRPGQM